MARSSRSIQRQKIPSEGQGRIALRRGSRLNATILRVVTGSKHCTPAGVSLTAKKLLESDKRLAEEHLDGSRPRSRATRRHSASKLERILGGPEIAQLCRGTSLATVAGCGKCDKRSEEHTV